jgi:hypothetical protein
MILLLRFRSVRSTSNPSNKTRPRADRAVFSDKRFPRVARSCSEVVLALETKLLLFWLGQEQDNCPVAVTGAVLSVLPGPMPLTRL